MNSHEWFLKSPELLFVNNPELLVVNSLEPFFEASGVSCSTWFAARWDCFLEHRLAMIAGTPGHGLPDEAHYTLVSAQLSCTRCHRSWQNGAMESLVG